MEAKMTAYREVREDSCGEEEQPEEGVLLDGSLACGSRDGLLNAAEGGTNAQFEKCQEPTLVGRGAAVQLRRFLVSVKVFEVQGLREATMLWTY